MNFDLLIFRYLNNLAGNNVSFDRLGVFVADYLPYFIIVSLLIYFLADRKNRLKNITMFSVAFSSGFIARFVVKSFILIFYDRPRPYIALESVHQLISTSIRENWQSFPSGHTIFFFALSTGIYFYNKKMGSLLLIISAFIGVARVFVGVHYPGDIVAGAILGVFTAYSINMLYIRWHTTVDRILQKVFYVFI